MIDRIDHIEIVSSDAEEMVEFLKLLGLEEHRSTDHHGTSYELTVGEDGPLFEIHTVEGEEIPGINHIAFAVDDLEEFTAELREKGFDDIEDPHFIEPTGRVVSSVRGPDGRRFQLVSDEK